MLPTAIAFNHVVVLASLGGKDVWMDGTIAGQGGGPFALANGCWERVLVVRAGETGLRALCIAGGIGLNVKLTSRIRRTWSVWYAAQCASSGPYSGLYG